MNKALVSSFFLIALALFSCNKEVIIEQEDPNTSQSVSSEAISERIEPTDEIVESNLVETETQEVYSEQEVTIFNIEKVYEMHEGGLVNGSVTDAQKGAAFPLSSAEIAFTQTETGKVIFTTKTDHYGLYKTPLLPPGNYFVNIKKAGYISIVNIPFVVEISRSKEANFHLSKFLNSNELRIVLSWNSSTPGVARDLDGRLYIDGEDKPVYFLNQNSKDLRMATLDIDDQDFVGPETITIKKDRTQSFSYFVNNFDPLSEIDGIKGELGLSGARVQIFNENKMIKNYSIPKIKAGHELSGNWFNVFDLTINDDGQLLIEDRMIYSDEKKK